MTLYYSLCFLILCAEVTLYAAVIFPMPYKFKRQLLVFLSENPIVAKVNYGLKISFIFVAVLFVDAVQRMIKIAGESRIAKEQDGMQDVRAETNYHARKFYAQRNIYLTGATLLMALFLTRTFYITLDLVKSQEQLNTLKNSTAKNSASTRQSQDLQDELAALKKQIANKEQDIQKIRREAGQNEGAFDELSAASKKQI